MPNNFFPFRNGAPRVYAGGNLWRASFENFAVLNGLAIQSLTMNTGAIREPHLHPNAHQLDYCISGTATVGIVGPDGVAQYLNLTAGDISFVPQGYLHWIENTSPGSLDFLVVLSHEEPETIELSSMLRGIPGPTLQHLYGLAPDTFTGLPAVGLTIVA